MSVLALRVLFLSPVQFSLPSLFLLLRKQASTYGNIWEDSVFVTYRICKTVN